MNLILFVLKKKSDNRSTLWSYNILQERLTFPKITDNNKLSSSSMKTSVSQQCSVPQIPQYKNATKCRKTELHFQQMKLTTSDSS